jgi:hypothetical protein
LSRHHAHRDVAERFRFFLRAVGLSREDFAQAVDGAIEPRSLFSVLNGSRQPSRALAVLIERTWGFRADFLLHGKGEMWAKPTAAASAAADDPLSPGEAQVLRFMRSSLGSARSLEGRLDEARIWSHLFSRMIESAQDLDACGRSASDEELRTYPLCARLLFEDCVQMGVRFEQYARLRHRQRVHRLIDRFLRHFLNELPRRVLDGPDREKLDVMLKPVFEHRRQVLRSLEESIRNLEATLENLADLGSPRQDVEARGRRTSIRQRRRLLERLAESAPEDLRSEAQGLVAEIESEADLATTYWTRLQRLLRDLLEDVAEAPPPMVEAQSGEELRARRRALLEPLTT